MSGQDDNRPNYKLMLSEDEQSIKAYFGKFLYANLDEHEVRDMILGYFVDKIYLYDDKVILTCKYSDADYEVDWGGLPEGKKAARGKVRPSRAQLHQNKLPATGLTIVDRQLFR